MMFNCRARVFNNQHKQGLKPADVQKTERMLGNALLWRVSCARRVQTLEVSLQNFLTQAKQKERKSTKINHTQAHTWVL